MASENEKRETLADIVRKMRKLGELDEKSTDRIQRSLMGLGLRTYADRIEAAWKREKAEIEADALAVGGIVEAARKREAVTNCNHIGNAAAMYDALVKIHDKVNSLDEECGVDPVEVRDIARAALKKPARNCDLYKTAREAEKAFDDFCLESLYGKCKPCDCTLPRNTGAGSCLLAWLFAPAAERKGDGDGR